MTIIKQVNLSQMYPGQSGKVVKIDGGVGLVSRLSAMGIRPGRKITKLSSMLMRGPVTVQQGSTRLAIGFGMARKILVEIEQ
ncbi:MAG: ferrous iron transport protein A [Dehalococcoidia bacterium]|jgi:ferrous iron transport protein A|nr:ferrous iron transport protein A [Dehalococcoidia bacterium]TET48452.1 MAG: ferrous iron transport protein A [Dehalococcoidia bacterium]